MSDDIVLASADAIRAAAEMQKTLDGALMSEIDNMRRFGNTLSDPSHWRGPLATQFRSDWSDTQKSLDKVKAAIEQLRANAAKITRAITDAGGGR